MPASGGGAFAGPERANQELLPPSGQRSLETLDCASCPIPWPADSEQGGRFLFLENAGIPWILCSVPL